eukprot:s124_g20.t1
MAGTSTSISTSLKSALCNKHISTYITWKRTGESPHRSYRSPVPRSSRFPLQQMRSPAPCFSMPLMLARLIFFASSVSAVSAVSLVDEVAGESTVIVDAIGELLTDALQLSDEDKDARRGKSSADSKVHPGGRPPTHRHRRDAHRAASGSISARKQSHGDQQKPAELLELDVVDEKMEADVPRTKMMRSEHQKHRCWLMLGNVGGLFDFT